MAKHQLSIDTVEKLNAAKNGSTWRACAVDLGYTKEYAATLNQVGKQRAGVITLEAENVLRQKLGLAPRSRPRYLYLRLRPDEVALFEQLRAIRDAVREAQR